MPKLKPLITALLVLILLVTGCAKEKINLQQETKSPQTGQAENTPVPEQQQPFQTKQNTPVQLTPQPEQATSNQQQTQQPQKAPVSSETNYSLNVGGIFPPFTLPDLNGSEVNSKELFKNNKLTVINVWSST